MQVRKGDLRRSQILSVAERLFSTEGFDAVPVSRIIEETGLSKGGFYHHFDSKEALLEEICLMRAERSFRATQAAVDGCAGGAVDKLNSMFDKFGLWNETDADYLGLLMRIAYRPENLRMREALKVYSSQRTLPLLDAIIAEGARAGVFDTPFPEGIGRIIMHVGNCMADALAAHIFNDGDGPPDMVYILEELELYRHTIERLLGAPPDAVVLYQMRRISEVVEGIRQKQGMWGVQECKVRRRGRVPF